MVYRNNADIIWSHLGYFLINIKENLLKRVNIACLMSLSVDGKHLRGRSHWQCCIMGLEKWTEHLFEALSSYSSTLPASGIFCSLCQTNLFPSAASQNRASFPPLLSCAVSKLKDRSVFLTLNVRGHINKLCCSFTATWASVSNETQPQIPKTLSFCLFST